MELPDFELHDIYRALDVLDKVIRLPYRRVSMRLLKLNATMPFFTTTAQIFSFEIEEEKGIRKYGKSKEHRPNPIVQFGLFLDGNGFPLAFTVFPGNENEQPTLIPMEKKIINDFSLAKFIICTDGTCICSKPALQ